NAKITANSAAIDQNRKAIALKVDQTTVDNTNRTVQRLKAQLDVQVDQINSKVSSSDLDARGYATQAYTQTQIKQASDSWNASLTSVQNGLTDSYTNLHATVDGIQAQVYNSDGSSKITLLSDLVATKVSQGDYNAQITLLENDIDLRVAKGNVVSQINQEAGGNTLIQVANGKGTLILNADTVDFTGTAFIPAAYITDLTADKIKAGTLTGSTVHLGDTNGNTIDLGVLGTNYVGLHSSAKNGDQTYIDYNGIKNRGTGYSTVISQGKITTGYMTVNGGGLIDFRSNGNGTTIDSQNIKFYNSNSVNGGIEFSGGSPLATVRNGTIGNELRVRYDRSFALTPIKDESARICASSAAMQVGFIQSGSSTPDRQTTGLWVDGDKRHVNLGVWGADSTWARVEANTHNIHMQADKAHAWLSSDNVFHIYKDGDSGSTATQLRVDGWAWINGWVEAAGHSQHSALSTKTDIQPVDDDKMLEMVNGTDLATFLYKTDVANGDTHRHIGLIIDDVHDVAQYQTPQGFIAPNGVSRDDDNMIGALFGAVKALTKRIKILESKVG
ncbi:tail fiber domain-containing protein, partial [Limosilactobacillus mucosae]